MNLNNERDFVIPGLTRNPGVHHWIPAFAGMTVVPPCFRRTARFGAKTLCPFR